jgi:hypothetical protein
MQIHDQGAGKVRGPSPDRAAESALFPRPIDRAEAPRGSAPGHTRSDEAASANVDRLELSAASQALASEDDPIELAERRARIDELRQAIAERRLVTPELVARAARRILGG